MPHKNIEVHCRKTATGEVSRLNSLTSDNAAVMAAGPDRRDAERERVMALAKRLAYVWGDVLHDHHVYVAETRW